MRLLKLAFWLGLVVLLMPSDEAQQARIYQNAAAALEKATTFCDRNARTCDTANAVWTVFVKKLEFAARMGYELATSSGRNEDGARYEPAALPSAHVLPQPRSLRPDDQAPAWRGRSGY